MSTSYYRLQDPFTSLRLEEGPGHDRLTVWEQHANCGTLTVSIDARDRAEAEGVPQPEPEGQDAISQP